MTPIHAECVPAGAVREQPAQTHPGRGHTIRQLAVRYHHGAALKLENVLDTKYSRAHD